MRKSTCQKLVMQKVFGRALTALDKCLKGYRVSGQRKR